MEKVSLKEFSRISDHDLTQLFEYVNQQNHSQTEEIELKEFKDKTNMWCRNSNSEFFGVFNNAVFVGTISLSKQNIIARQACIGYEIFKKFRKQGFASTAFKLVLELANSKNFSTLHAKIQKENKASINIWKNEGAVFKEFDTDKVEATLCLYNNDFK